MKHISNFNNFILENQYQDSYKELIEDCFLEFCEEYDQQIKVEEGYFLINPDFIDTNEFGNFIQSSNVDTFIKDIQRYNDKHRSFDSPKTTTERGSKGYKVTLLRKGVGVDRPIVDQTDIWKEEMTSDFEKCIKRIKEMSDSTLIPDNENRQIFPSFWQISCMFKIN